MTVRIRTGLVGKKVGMTNMFTDTGETVAVTLVQIADNYIYRINAVENSKQNNIAIAYDTLEQKKATKNTVKISTADGVKFFRHVKEFRVNTAEVPQVSKKLSLNHFAVGQTVDVTGNATGKGFAGAMKRHNFRGLEATHGVSVTHRSHGSTGQRQDPGKVFKGKKMAGHMGTNQVTVQNLMVQAIDEELQLIAISGAIPGTDNSFVFINDAIKSYLPDSLPFPAAYDEGAPVADTSSIASASSEEAVTPEVAIEAQVVQSNQEQENLEAKNEA